MMCQVLNRMLRRCVRAKGTHAAVNKKGETLLHTKKRDGTVGPINSARAFLEYERNPETYRDPLTRAKDWKEINTSGHSPIERKKQAARCMDCGTPFCQTHTGCPINNLIPEWNELVLRDQWEAATERLHKTNNFPEFTGRVCPAPCEGACVAGLVDKSVTIKNIEYSIVERAWQEGWLVPSPPHTRSGQTVAIIGSGPAGLAAADQLNQMGHLVTVFEREDEIGGLLMYGIPNMKLDKQTVRRRVQKLSDEGVQFEVNTHVGRGRPVEDLMLDFHAVVLAVGSTEPRDLAVEGRELSGVHFAMDFLSMNQRALTAVGAEGDVHDWDGQLISARGKRVMVIGGGDTGTDCIGTSIRHGCKSVVNLELLPRPPPRRDTDRNPWPEWPRVFNVDYGHGEAKAIFGDDPRTFQVMTEGFISDADGRLRGVRTVGVEPVEEDGKTRYDQIEGTETEWDVDLVVLALGFVAPEQTLVDSLGLATDARGNFLSQHNREKNEFRALSRRFGTEIPGVFVAGDCRRGQSLVVWAIQEGRLAADSVDEYLAFKREEEQVMFGV